MTANKEAPNRCNGIGANQDLGKNPIPIKHHARPKIKYVRVLGLDVEISWRAAGEFAASLLFFIGLWVLAVVILAAGGRY